MTYRILVMADQALVKIFKSIATKLISTHTYILTFIQTKTYTVTNSNNNSSGFLYILSKENTTSKQ